MNLADAPPSLDHPVTERSTLEARLSKLWDALSDDVDAILVCGYGELHRYGALTFASGYCPNLDHGYAILTPGAAPVLLVSGPGHAAAARKTSPGAVVRHPDPVEGDADLTSLLVRVLTQMIPLDHLGIVGGNDVIPVRTHHRVVDALPDIAVIDVDEQFADIRARKSDEELHLLAGAVQIAEAGAQALRRSIAPGVTGWQLAGEVERATRRMGATHVLVIIGPGPFFIPPPSSEPIRAGDLVTAYVEVAGPLGHWVEQAELFAIGDIGGRRLGLAETTLTSLAEGERHLVVGSSPTAVVDAMSEVGRRDGFVMGAGCGHGVGLGDRDLPAFSTANSTSMLEDMVVALHPQIRDEPPTIGASAGATFHLGPNGARPITTRQHEVHHIARAGSTDQ